jgi:hypothetical protein
MLRKKVAIESVIDWFKKGSLSDIALNAEPISYLSPIP